MKVGVIVFPGSNCDRDMYHVLTDVFNLKAEFFWHEKSLPKNIRVTHQSLFDKSIEGIELKNKPVFSVQYHPESNPGPQDSVYLFDKFVKSMKKNAKKKRY